jgi:hypothetical protein
MSFALWRFILMNDFTKEELKIIYLNCCNNTQTEIILKKIGSIIEHYCDHKNYYDHLPVKVKKCLTCNKVLL